MAGGAGNDRWDSALYDDRHSFVWQKSADLIDVLNPQPGERVLDLGCGTGHLTAQIAARGAEVTGLDASASMIALARQNYPKLKFVLGDARQFRCETPFDAVFSNAALHWIPEADEVAESIAKALRGGGRLVLEMGARGNVGRIQKALEMTLGGRSVPYVNPWYFPDAAEYSAVLERHGLRVRMTQEFDRRVKLEHPDKGLREWLEMFAGKWLEPVPAAEMHAVLEELEHRLRPELWDGDAWWADYRRLRVVAVKD